MDNTGNANRFTQILNREQSVSLSVCCKAIKPNSDHLLFYDLFSAYISCEEKILVNICTKEGIFPDFLFSSDFTLGQTLPGESN